MLLQWSLHHQEPRICHWQVSFQQDPCTLTLSSVDLLCHLWHHPHTQSSLCRCPHSCFAWLCVQPQWQWRDNYSGTCHPSQFSSGIYWSRIRLGIMLIHLTYFYALAWSDSEMSISLGHPPSTWLMPSSLNWMSSVLHSLVPQMAESWRDTRTNQEESTSMSSPECFCAKVIEEQSLHQNHE